MASELKIGGVTVDACVAADLCGYRLVPYSVRGRASFEFARRVGSLRAAPDPYLGQTVELWIDSVLRFAGDIDDVSEPFDSRYGWVQLYRCADLRSRADRVPVTDPTQRLDAILFNLPDDDIDYRDTRAGRMLGAILKYAIEAPDTAARLDALGIGGFSSTGWGADATAAISGGDSLTITVNDGGADYTAAPAVVLVGGDGIYTSATATVSAGAVTGISVSGASGWTEAPEVWIGTLPADTLDDLARLTFISPNPVVVAGDMIFAAVEGLLRNHEPNVTLHVEPDGTIRFHDLREFAGPRIVIEGDGSGATARAITDSTGAVVSVVVLTPGMDYTTATARAIGGGGSGATFTVTLDADEVDSIAVDTGGSGYRYARTLEMGVDPIEPFQLQRDARGCFTRVVVRGQPEAEMVELRLSKGDLAEDFAYDSYTNLQAKENWSLEDFEGGGRDEGVVTGCTSTTVTIESDDATRTYSINECDQSNRKGHIFLKDTVVAGIDSLVNRPIVANTAMTAGGSMTVTLSRALPSTSYDEYTITFLAGGGANVWRQYSVTNADIAIRMLQYASYPLPIKNSDGSSVRLTSTPVLIIQFSDSGSPPYLESPMGCTIDPDAGTVLADRPVVTLFGNRSDLLTGGYPIAGEPADVILYVPVNKGDQEAIFPPDGSSSTAMFAGTGYTDYGIERTLVISVGGWRDPGMIDAMEEYALAVWASVSDVPVEGSVVYRGLYSTALDMPLALNFAGDGYTTGWEDAALPVVDCEVVWEESGAELYTTRMSLSNRRLPYSAANFLQPEPTGDMLGMGLEGLNNGGLMAAPASFAGQAPGSGFIDPSTWGASGPGAQAVLGMSAALRSGAIGPAGAAVRAAQGFVGTAQGMAASHVGGAQAAAAGLVHTASTASPYTFGGNGGTSGARVDALREQQRRAKAWQSDPTAFLPPESRREDDDDLPFGVGG